MGWNLSATNLYPCLRGVLGDWVFYSTLLTAEQIATTINTAGSIREAKSLEDFLQRQLRERVKKIENYLRTAPSRFFNSIIVGVFDAVPDWIEFDLTSAIEKSGGLDRDALTGVRESMGLLRFSGEEKMFAIDGQHRAAAIRSMWQQRDGAAAGILEGEQFSVIFVAHVDDTLGKKRTRRLFSDINKRAVPVSKGDLAIIDEEDVTAIVARRLYAEYRPFSNGLVSLTEVANLDPNDEIHFTNLLTLVTVNQKLKPLYRKRRKTLESDESNVASLLSIARSFYDLCIAQLTPLRQYFTEKTVTLRALRTQNANLLARPIGLVVLSEVYRAFAKAGRLADFTERIDLVDFSERGHFDGILWDKGRVIPRNRPLAVKLSIYLVAPDMCPDIAALQSSYAEVCKGHRLMPPPLSATVEAKPAKTRRAGAKRAPRSLK